MNENAYSTVLALRERATVVGGLEPNHFVFPACEHGIVDPSNPVRSWRSAWRQIAQASGLKGLRFHDLRHHAITELAESQASDSTIMAIAGHVSPKMLAHYSHVRLQAKRDALEALCEKGKTPPHVTNDVTNPDVEEASQSEVLERYGRHEETRTPDLYRVKVAL